MIWNGAVTMTAVLRSTILIVLYALPLIGYAQDNIPFEPEMKSLVAHTSWTGRDGAPGDVSALAQTTDGYLWLGTPLGLYRFDGLQFASYPVTELDAKLPSTDIYALAADAEGGLWIGFRIGGISYLSLDGRITNYNLQNGRGPNSAQKIVIRQDHSVWALADHKVMVLRNERWKDFGAQHALPDDQLLSLFFDSAGNLWTSARKMLFVLRPGHIRFDLYPTESFQIVDLAERPGGQIWVSDGWHSVHPLGEDARRKVIPVKGYVRMLIEPSGTLWLAQDYRGVSHVLLGSRDEKSREPEAEPELSSEQTNAILRDRDGDIWIGTSRGLDRLQFAALKALSNTRVEYYPSLASDPRNGVWIAALAHPVVHAEGDVLRWFGKGVGSSPVVCDDDSRLWLVDPVRNALKRYDRGEVTEFPVPDAVRRAAAQSIGLDRDGAILISFDDAGLWRFNGQWEQIRDAGLPDDQPLSIVRDAQRRVWLGYANSGIVMRDESGFHTLSNQNAGSLGNVLTFALAHGRLWAAGTNGLGYLMQGSFHRISIRKDAVLRGISGVVEDRSGDLWLNASTGIVRIGSSEIEKTLAGSSEALDYDLLDERQGLLGTATQIKPTPSAVTDRDGLLWLATSGHVYSIDPAKVSLGRPSPILALENVLVGGVSILDREHIRSSFTMGARRSHEIEFDYIGIDLGSPEKVSYRYLLEGEDKDWHDAGSRRQAFYTDLGPGSYRFRVQSTNGKERWVELSRPLSLTITPAFYQTLWFYALCLVAVFALLYLIYLLRVQHILNRMRERMRERTGERLRIARELHDTLLQSIHGLVLRVHFAAESLPPDEPARASLQLALTRADEVILEGRRRVQDLREEVPEAANLAAQIASIAEELAVRKSMSFRIVEDGQCVELDPQIQRELCVIAREALTNTVRHAQAPGAEIFLVYANSYFLMRCCDTGVGLAPSVLARGNRAGHWGLVGIRERVLAIEGKIQFWSAPGAGTEIEIRLPGRRAYRVPHTRMMWLKRLMQLRQDAGGRESSFRNEA